MNQHASTAGNIGIDKPTHSTWRTSGFHFTFLWPDACRQSDGKPYHHYLIIIPPSSLLPPSPRRAPSFCRQRIPRWLRDHEHDCTFGFERRGRGRGRYNIRWVVGPFDCSLNKKCRNRLHLFPLFLRRRQVKSEQSSLATLPSSSSREDLGVANQQVPSACPCVVFCSVGCMYYFTCTRTYAFVADVTTVRTYPYAPINSFFH